VQSQFRAQLYAVYIGKSLEALILVGVDFQFFVNRTMADDCGACQNGSNQQEQKAEEGEPMPIAAIAKVISKIPAPMRMDLSLELIFLVKSRSDRFMFNFRVKCKRRAGR